MGLLGWLVVLLGVVFSIAWHEIGHLVPAKAFGVKCTQYMIGFGPTVWSRRVGETEYGVKAVPLGGYVRMIGMFPPARGADRRGRFAEMIEQARSDARREIGPEDADRQFYQRSVPKRLVIMLGGPVMNLILALALFTTTFMVFGVVRETFVGSVSQCVLPVGAKLTDCRPGDQPSPAAKAGLLPGDRLLAVDGVRSDDWRDLLKAIRGAPGRTVAIEIEREGRRTVVQAPIIPAQRERLDADDNPVIGPDGKAEMVTVGFLGINNTGDYVRVGVADVPGALVQTLSPVLSSLAHVPEKFAGVVKTVTTGAERDPESPISIVGVGRIGGEVGSMDVPVRDKVASWLVLLAALNLALFLFNLVPLLPLDGGHAAGAIWEGLRRTAARLFRRPDPGPVDVARALPLAYTVAVLLVGMSLVLVYADVVDPIRLNG
ncbi:MAG: site-2 protease family protein [Kineosporiaceae bacterium]